MKESIQKALEALEAVEASFVRAEVSALEHSRRREAAIAQALVAVAADQGLLLQQPLHIDANGEFSVVALKSESSNPQVEGTAAFGPVFAELLSRHGARMGMVGGYIGESNGWCRLNHFEAARLVKSYGLEVLG